MKVLLITLVKTDVGFADGVVRKIFNQVEILKAYGYDVDYTYVHEGELYCVHNGEKRLVKKAEHVSGIVFLKALSNYVRDHSYDVVYIRHVGRADPWLLKLLKTINEMECLLLYELPTYPYINHAQNLMARIDNFVNNIFQYDLSKYVNRIITFSDDDKIFGIPTIKIMNGISVGDYEPIKGKDNSEDIHLIAVSSMRRFHGYERVIEGLGEYYRNQSTRNIELYFVGDGSELKRYRQIVDEYHLEKHVFFCGRKSGEDLNRLFDKCDIALSSFGWYKCKVHLSSALKVREYLAKGLPIISGGKEDVFVGKNMKFYLEFPNDSSAVNFNEVVRFYDNLYPVGENCEMLRKEIRRFAEEHVDMKITMEPIRKYIERSERGRKEESDNKM